MRRSAQPPDVVHGLRNAGERGNRRRGPPLRSLSPNRSERRYVWVPESRFPERATFRSSLKEMPANQQLLTPSLPLTHLVVPVSCVALSVCKTHNGSSANAIGRHHGRAFDARSGRVVESPERVPHRPVSAWPSGMDRPSRAPDAPPPCGRGGCGDLRPASLGGRDAYGPHAGEDVGVLHRSSAHARNRGCGGAYGFEPVARTTGILAM